MEHRNSVSLSMHHFEATYKSAAVSMADQIWLLLHQHFSRTFFIFFSKICELECNTNCERFSQSEFVLHSNASKYKKKTGE